MELVYSLGRFNMSRIAEQFLSMIKNQNRPLFQTKVLDNAYDTLI